MRRTHSQVHVHIQCHRSPDPIPEIPAPRPHLQSVNLNCSCCLLLWSDRRENPPTNPDGNSCLTVDVVVLLCSKNGRSSGDVARLARRDGLLGRFGRFFALFSKEALHLGEIVGKKEREMDPQYPLYAPLARLRINDPRLDPSLLDIAPYFIEDLSCSRYVRNPDTRCVKGHELGSESRRLA